MIWFFVACVGIPLLIGGIITLWFYILDRRDAREFVRRWDAFVEQQRREYGDGF